MTLALTVNSSKSIWSLVDRRLSAPGRTPKDDGRKAMLLETFDGKGILTYAGLGSTARGTEPADWMSAVLRGRDLPFEASLQALAAAVQEQIPKHLVRAAGRGGPGHHIIANAIVGDEVRLYTIDLAFATDRRTFRFGLCRPANTRPGGKPRPPRLCVEGTGGRILAGRKEWIRPLLKLVAAYDRGRVSGDAVADHLAGMNLKVSKEDPFVGPRCIVVWESVEGGQQRPAAGQWFYTNNERDPFFPCLPRIRRGGDFKAFVDALQEAMMPSTLKRFAALRAGEQVPDTGEVEREQVRDEMNAALARLPTAPDEDLR